MKEVSCFYRELFQTLGYNREVQNIRRELLQYTTRRVLQEQKEEMERVPTKEKTRKILQALPKGKASELDGMTAKVLLTSWSLLKADRMAMIWKLWSSSILPHNTTIGVMKIISRRQTNVG